MNPHALASTPQCATATGHLIGTLLLGTFVLAILICTIGWSRASVERIVRKEHSMRSVAPRLTDPRTDGPADVLT